MKIINFLKNKISNFKNIAYSIGFRKNEIESKNESKNEIKNPVELSKNNIKKLNNLLEAIEFIDTNENGTSIKFKGHIVMVSDGTIINQSLHGHVVQLGKTIHLNPPLKNINSVGDVDKSLLKIQKDSLKLIKN